MKNTTTFGLDPKINFIIIIIVMKQFAFWLEYGYNWIKILSLLNHTFKICFEPLQIVMNTHLNI